MDSPDLRKAISLLPAEAQHARTQRLVRAADIDCKHEHLPEHLQNYDPWVREVRPILEDVEKRRIEKTYSKGEYYFGL